jgi:hypothetical protein
MLSKEIKKQGVSHDGTRALAHSEGDISTQKMLAGIRSTLILLGLI